MLLFSSGRKNQSIACVNAGDAGLFIMGASDRRPA